MKVKYSEVAVGEKFSFKDALYIRKPHNKGLNVATDTYVSMKKHALVECETPYGEIK